MNSRASLRSESNPFTAAAPEVVAASALVVWPVVQPTYQPSALVIPSAYSSARAGTYLAYVRLVKSVLA